MKRFLIPLGVFGILVFLTLNAVGWILIRTGKQGHAVENSRIYHCLEKARKPWPGAGVFVLGDSVANQMYPPEGTSGRINSLALVMPSTLAGQYFLLQRLAGTNNLDNCVVALVLSPSGFAGEFVHDSSYHYVLKPFHSNEFRPWEDEFYQARVRTNAVTRLSQWPIVKCSNLNPPEWMPYLNTVALKPSAGLSTFSEHYLRQINKLVTEGGGTLRILPTIQPKSEAGETYESLKSGIRLAGLDNLFIEYFDRFEYFPDEAFRDGAHVRNREILGNNVLGL